MPGLGKEATAVDSDANGRYIHAREGAAPLSFPSFSSPHFLAFHTPPDGGRGWIDGRAVILGCRIDDLDDDDLEVRRGD